MLLLLKVRGSTSSGCCPNQSSQLRDTTPVMNRQKNEAWNAGNFKGTLFSFPLDWKNNFVLELTTTVEGIHLPVNGGNSTKLGRHFEQVHLHFVAHWETKKIFFFFFSFFFLLSAKLESDSCVSMLKCSLRNISTRREGGEKNGKKNILVNN